MKTFIKICAKFLIGLVILIVVIFGIRVVNGWRYSTDDNTSAEMKNPQDLSLYNMHVDGLSIKHLDRDTLQGFHIVPKKVKHRGMVICYGGSEGSPNYAMAIDLAKHGYETMAVFMFGQPHQPKTLVKIPLEQFSSVLDEVRNLGKEKEPLTVLGVSKGAEYALNVATKYPQIDQMILMAPSCYCFSGLDFKDFGSSWTWKGQELPYVSTKKSDFGDVAKGIILPQIFKTPLRFVDVYRSAIVNDGSEDKQIPVGEIKAKMLLIAGADDQMWPSAEMAKRIANNRPSDTVVKIYPNAGHIFRGDGIVGPFAIGGNITANQAAQRESEQAILDFLAKYHV